MPKTLLFVGQVPSNVTHMLTMHDGALGTEPHLNPYIALDQPLHYGPTRMNLSPNGPGDNASGYQGDACPMPIGLKATDFMWKWDRRFQMVPMGKLIWYDTDDNTWKFAKSGFPTVPQRYFSPCDAVLYQRSSRAAAADWFTAPVLQYTPPNTSMAP